MQVRQKKGNASQKTVNENVSHKTIKENVNHETSKVGTSQRPVEILRHDYEEQVLDQ